MLDFITLCDGYKLDHRRQYPAGTQHVYSNWTARSSRIPGQDRVVFLGLQYFIKAYLMDLADRTFFSRPKTVVVDHYRRFLDGYLGPNDIGVDHIEALHDLGYIPLRFDALHEGTLVPLRVPMFTMENTHPDFFWVTNYIETMLSSVLWMACTSATTAYRYRVLLDAYAGDTGDPAFVQWQAHDFSFRGMASPEAAALSGLGHLLYFTGTDSLPAIQIATDYYGATGLIGGSVPATEHSVMCAGGKDDELETYSRILDLYPKGIVSVVSDTWDLWKVIDQILPALKDKILARDGKLVIRPDSGDPADILCGDPSKPEGSTARKGVIQALWDQFGGSVNDKGYRQLDPHIGAIYGDSITEARAADICRRLRDEKFASTNVVFGIGSYTYQYVTRDVYGFAVKATWARVNGEECFLHKDPATDNGSKKSARGRLAVVNGSHGLTLVDGLSYTDLSVNLLRSVWEDGRFVRERSFDEIRQRAQS